MIDVMNATPPSPALSKLRALHQAATPGPWIGTEHGYLTHADNYTDPHNNDKHVTFGPDGDGAFVDGADAIFVAALRNAAPLLLDVVDAAAAWALPARCDGVFPYAEDFLEHNRKGLAAIRAALDALTTISKQEQGR